MNRIVVDGTSRTVEPGVTAGQTIDDPAAVAALIDGRLSDLSTEVGDNSRIETVRFGDDVGREIFWHSSAHLMAQAVKQLFPAAKVAIGPAIPDGFYYDFEVVRPFSEADLVRIEKRMKKLAEQRIPVMHRWFDRQEALEMFRQRKEDYKVEIIEGLPDEKISVYQQGDFVDLCRGPHLADTSQIKAVKLLSVAGAYWRGDERNTMLSRIYGVSFPDEAQLVEHLARLDEAQRRDHRRLGPKLELFSFSEEVGAGLMLWHPKGATVRRLLRDYWEREHIAAGYQFVVTPHIARGGLWQRSGHYGHFREHMYVLPVDEEEYVLKPMNCPAHMMIFKSRVHSYRELPLRMGEWGTVYRHERSGTLHGGMRVRGFTQDDAHIFCTEEQVEEETRGVVELSLRMLRALGFSEFRVDLSVRDSSQREHYLGDDRQWSLAEAALQRTLERIGLAYTRAEGEAVFYGPKIDIKLLDSLGREWQCATCQFDFNLAERFGLRYAGQDGHQHRVYLVHRTVFGGIERFFGILIEHFAGAFPMWLAPVQARVLTVTDAAVDYAEAVRALLAEAKLRVEIDAGTDKIARKIAEAESLKIPYMIIVGSREAAGRTVALRRHGAGDLGSLDLDHALSRLTEEAAEPISR